jgi:cysteinyl-tRNA synthetase
MTDPVKVLTGGLFVCLVVIGGLWNHHRPIQKRSETVSVEPKVVPAPPVVIHTPAPAKPEAKPETPVVVEHKAEPKSSIPPVPIAEQLNVDSFGLWIKRPDPNAIAAAKVDLMVTDMYIKKALIPAADLKKMSASKKLLAYISVAQAEDFRDYWKKEWTTNPPKWLGAPDPVWKGVYSIKNPNDPEWIKIATDMVTLAIAQGYDGVAFDGVQNIEDKAAASGFMSTIAKYAKSKDPQLIVLAIDGEHLFDDANYAGAFDGIIKQDLVFNSKSNGLIGTKNSKTELDSALAGLRNIKKLNKVVLVVEYVSGALWEDAKKVIASEQFIGYSAPRELNYFRQKQ